jgi:hypothetical protein
MLILREYCRLAGGFFVVKLSRGFLLNKFKYRRCTGHNENLESRD